MSSQKIALITGASQGLGKAMALQLAAQGTDIIFSYHKEQAAANEVVAQIEALGRKAIGYQADMGNMESVARLLKQATDHLQEKTGSPQFDFLINNAGNYAITLVSDTEEDVLDNLYRVHLKGMYMLTKQALPFIRDNGRIVNISSGLTRFTVLGRSAYASIKGAVEVFTRYLALEVGQRGITANVVAPGIVHTQMTHAQLEDAGRVQLFENSTALGRVGMPEDIAGVVGFLCSAEARWVTAQRIEASGGIFL
ncbi:SDR family oxidoreductase [Chitinophaga sp.]|uniref:SDR family NAD(P)-dependent oxidoreductase n=1 Tax=Chitinophaga sp. TaxID=1869181 RepID=UPI0031D9E928